MELFITGIDTDSGKSIVTGLLARYLIHQQKTVITQKYIQTGCKNIAEDLLTHRKIMNLPLTNEDHKGLTCSYLFKYPASPHLSAQLENQEILTETITKATNKLSDLYEFVLMEGAGGLMVPLNSTATLIDYIQEQNYPCILVSSSKLGSINHSLLSIEVLKKRNMNLIGVVYNQYPNTSPLITQDSEIMIQKYLQNYYPNAGFVSIPEIDFENIEPIDFSPIVKIHS